MLLHDATNSKTSVDSGIPKVKLITFGAGKVEYEEAAQRLIEQSKAFPCIDERRAYTAGDLPSEYHDLFSGITGYGNFSWKPYLIYSDLLSLQPNDMLIYIDAGCELNKNGVSRFDGYLSFASKNDVLLFELPHPNRYWTKNHPKLLLGYPEHYFRNQLVATVIFMKNNQRTRQLIKAWLDLCAYEGGVLLKEPEENEPQLAGFMKHRLDQSCLSICAYQHNVATLPDETYFEDWSCAKSYPILAFRNRTGNSVLDEKLKVRILRKLKMALRRLRK